MNYSLRHLLLVTLLSSTLLIWGIATYYSYKKTRDEVVELFDAELAQSAKVLLSFVDSLLQNGDLPTSWNRERNEAADHIYSLDTRSEGKLALQLWSEEMGLSLHSEKQPEIVVEESKEKQISKEARKKTKELTYYETFH